MGEETEQFKKAWFKNVELWFYGLLSAFISGGVSSISAIFIDPEKFNFGSGLKKVGEMFLISGLMSILPLLKQSPLPKLPEGEKK